MRSSPPVPVAARAASQESLMLEYLGRLERHRQDRKAVYLRLSALKPENRRTHHLKIAAGMFDPAAKLMQAEVFPLACADLVVLYKISAQDEIEAAIARLRVLFSEDPLIGNESLTGQVALCTWYSLDREYDIVLALARKMAREEEIRRAARFGPSDPGGGGHRHGAPFTPRQLAQAVATLEQADLANLIRRQAVCALVGKSPPQPVFQELFISIADLRQTVLPAVNVGSSPWLFQQLTETLDCRVLSMLNRHDDRTIDGDISINLNVSTLLSPEFLVFDDNVKAGMRGSIILELQHVDIYADMAGYLFARDYAHERGYRICIDGLTYEKLPYLDRERLGADLIKLVWDPALIEEADAKAEALRRIGVTRIILCRCDSPAAVTFGQSAGITLFQGRHIETLLQIDPRAELRKRVRTRSRP